jgi:hypothetical protein
MDCFVALLLATTIECDLKRYDGQIAKSLSKPFQKNIPCRENVKSRLEMATQAPRTRLSSPANAGDPVFQRQQ